MGVMSSTRHQQDQVLQMIVERIVKVADPEKVILFGSRAHGSPTEESDYDFFVLKSGVPNRLHLAQQIYLNLLDLPADASVDVIVETPETAFRHQENQAYIYREALKGRTVYERRPS